MRRDAQLQTFVNGPNDFDRVQIDFQIEIHWPELNNGRRKMKSRVMHEARLRLTNMTRQRENGFSLVPQQMVIHNNRFIVIRVPILFSISKVHAIGEW